MKFDVAISHDGPNQSVRGPDPFEDPEKKKIVMEFYKVMHPQRRISFNTMMNRRNTSRKKVYEWFVEFTDDPSVVVGEGGMIDAYDEDGANNSLDTLDEHFEYRKTSFVDIFSTDGQINFSVPLDKVDGFIMNVLRHSESKYVGQKCGMDNEHTIAVDLTGNIVTCQNVSVKETSKNGESHLGGNLDDYSNVELKSVTHWLNRPDCPSCPVLHLCRGSCMYLDGKYWDITCNNAYSDNIALFALAVERITEGYIPTLVKPMEGHLPLERQDIWGTIYEHQEKSKKKIIPIKVVSEKVSVNDIEVYGKSRVGV
jgi:uncharacterized protein